MSSALVLLGICLLGAVGTSVVAKNDKDVASIFYGFMWTFIGIAVIIIGIIFYDR